MARNLEPSAPPADPWGSGDPWSSSSLGSSWQDVSTGVQPTQDVWAAYSPQQSASSGQPQNFFTGDDLSDTDTATASTDGDPDYSSPNLVGR